MLRTALSLFVSSIVCLAAGLPSQAQATIPGYFFKEWRVNRACADIGHVSSPHTVAGLRFRITTASVLPDGRYPVQLINAEGQTWPTGWQNLKLAYRSGSALTSIPADFDCVPGSESSSPFLMMSGHTQQSEPYYPQEHWYGTTTFNGYQHHVLVFPRNVNGASSAAIVIINTGNLLDHNGTIIVES